jgi:hypothetical protein
MDANEFAELVPWLVAEKVDDATTPTPVMPGVMHEQFPSWSFRVSEVLAVAAVYPKTNELRITPGLGIHVPYTPEVSHYVNRLNNKQLIFGRAFLVGNEESGLGGVLMQEIIFGDTLSWDYPPSVQYALRQIATVCGQAVRLAPDLIARFNARPLRDDEAFFLQSNG